MLETRGGQLELSKAHLAVGARGLWGRAQQALCNGLTGNSFSVEGLEGRGLCHRDSPLREQHHRAPTMQSLWAWLRSNKVFMAKAGSGRIWPSNRVVEAATSPVRDLGGFPSLLSLHIVVKMEPARSMRFFEDQVGNLEESAA